MLVRICASLALLVACLAASPWATAENWSQWRGPRLDGISSEKGLPTSWSKTENVAWRMELPGAGGATPVIWDERIFLTSADGGDVVLICASTAGKELWKERIGSGNKSVRGDEGNYASPSPSTDGKHVWAFMGTGDLACFTVEGKRVWSFNVGDRYGKLKIQFGMTSTPVLDGDRLYLQLIHGEGRPKTREAVVVALDKATGNEIWKVDRDSDASDECEHSYASPTIYRDGEREFLISHGADYVIAHSMADGKELWRCGNLNPKDDYERTLRFVSSPAAAPGMIVVPSAKGGPVLALRPDGKGDVSDEKDRFHWQRKRDTPDVSTPLIVDGIVYLAREQGSLIAMDAKTGKELYQQRIHSSVQRASPVFADGNIYIAARNGTVYVVKHGPKFELVATNKMGEEIAASPATAPGRIYLRTFDALYAIGK